MNLQMVNENNLIEGLIRAQNLISDRTGVINKVWIEELAADEPAAFWAKSRPADMVPLFGMAGLNFGNAVSMDRNRALMKAIGECIERYCSAQYEKETLPLNSYKELTQEAVCPESFALFSEKQYAVPGFHFTKFEPHTPVRWVKGVSLVTQKEILVPASFVYVPYQFDPPDEPSIMNPISTGLACASSRKGTIYKGILEVIERDAFMITWQNRITPVCLDLSSVEDPFAQKFLDEFDHLPFEIHALVLTLDIDVPVILVLISSESGQAPYTVAGLGADCDMRRALVLALEEAFLTFLGMGREARLHTEGMELGPGQSNITNLDLHGLAHAASLVLQQSMKFLTESDVKQPIQDYPDVSSHSIDEKISYLVDQFAGRGYDIIYHDLTTLDVDEAGFKVGRVVIPGFQPLDINHRQRHLGGKRLYEVPVAMGLRREPLNEEGLNSFPHPFP